MAIKVDFMACLDTEGNKFRDLRDLNFSQRCCSTAMCPVLFNTGVPAFAQIRVTFPI